MIPVADSDAIYLYGCTGLNFDYSVRLSLRLTDMVDPEILKMSAENTQKRYPYLSVRLKHDDSCFYYEQNEAPITIHHSDQKTALGTEETNYHVWSISYNEDRLHLDCSHMICDGTGMYMLLSTLLYYYCNKKYGVTDHDGVRTLEDPILPEESIVPCRWYSRLTHLH